MSDLVLSLIDERIQKLTKDEADIATERGHLQRERDKLMKLATKSDAAPVKATKPKAAARKAAGGPSIKEQIMAHLRGGGAWNISQLAEALGAKKTTLNGTLHQLKKAGHVMNIGNGWEIAAPIYNPNSDAEARA